MENKLKVWIARDKDGELKVYFSRPIKDTIAWRYSEKDWGAIEIGLERYKFPSVKWEDKEPTEAYIILTLAEPQEQTKQEQTKQEHKIDWEQRRYEIAKNILSAQHDMLIQKLKEQSE